MSVTLYTASPSRLDVSLSHVFRYLNIREPDGELLKIADECLTEAKINFAAK